jgi:aminobenzoyl-glutamate utilization protein B
MFFTQEKLDAVEWIDDNQSTIIGLSDRIWLYAEPALQEYRAAAAIVEVLRNAGFSVETGVAGLETSFVATYGHGHPVIGSFAEYEAVDGTSQMPVPYKQEVLPGLAGCYDMHHGLGAGAVGAALAVKHAMDAHGVTGTFKLFGTPAEKNAFGKNVMSSAGIFDGLDACVGWHPSDETGADWFLSSQIRSNNQTLHTFDGVSVYNAMPWGGNNALHALELTDMAVNLIKDSIIPISSYPIISSILNKDHADYAVSSVPGTARSTYISRAMTRREHEKIQQRIFDCADGAALAMGVKVNNEVLTGTWEPIPNLVLAQAAHRNIEVIGVPQFSETDTEFGRLVQKSIGVEPSDTPFGNMTLAPPATRPARNTMITTDISTMTYKCPFVLISTNYLGAWGMPDWSTAAFSLSNIAHQSFLTAAKIIATTVLDLFDNQALLEEAKAEFAERTKDVRWTSPIPEGRPVPRLEPLPTEHYEQVVEAFTKGPKWEGWEPELSGRMETVAQSVLTELA